MRFTLTSNKDQPVIRLESRTHPAGTIEFTAEDLRQLNEFAATCPEFMESPVRNKPFPTIAIIQLNN